LRDQGSIAQRKETLKNSHEHDGNGKIKKFVGWMEDQARGRRGELLAIKRGRPEDSPSELKNACVQQSRTA
jgi:hypothetical protein